MVLMRENKRLSVAPPLPASESLAPGVVVPMPTLRVLPTIVKPAILLASERVTLKPLAATSSVLTPFPLM